MNHYEPSLENLPKCYLGGWGFVREGNLVSDKRSKGARFAWVLIRNTRCLALTASLYA